jgi:predicted ATPase/DNA-binding CsgD family transcriptional regulator/tRNA A-37 threonylcarbamoyl transferase component Bud32
MRDFAGEQLGNYRIVGAIGQGGFAQVYLGEHIYLKSQAAVKVLHTLLTEEAYASFMKEAKTLVRLHHPHIVRLLDYAVEAGVPFLVMEYAPGGSMRRLYPAGTHVPLETIVPYVQQIASALDYAHSQHLIHGDIKPENILLGSENDLLLSDFGLAVLDSQSHAYSTQLVAQQIAGTSLYLAPEQLQGRSQPASDLYSLASVVYEWLCGVPPFRGTAIEIAVKHLTMPPQPLREHLPDLSPAVEEVVLQGLAKDPEQRFPDVQEFASALERAYRGKVQRPVLAASPGQLFPSLDEYSPSTAAGSHFEPMWKVPTILTSLIGRERDVVAICKLLQSSTHRLVTLLGTGGIGKTRLSLQVAVEMRKHFEDGACFVSLAAISDPALLMLAIAQELGIQDSRTLSIVEQVKNFLCKRHFLLLLDNFEQLIAAVPLIEDLLESCPYLTILVTSRIVLHARSEQEFQVAPLALPDLAGPVERTALEQVASVQLFIQRARSILPDFQLTLANAHAIAEICVLLDGLPLAVELAAARIKLLPPPSLLARLSRRFDVLSNKIRLLAPHQQTLRSTLKWSYDLLDAAEQRLFRRLGIFVGGWTLDAVEAVCYYDCDTEQVSALDELASLLDKSLLLQFERDEAEPRLQMLMTVREYALECLQESGETEQTAQAHARYFLALAEEAEHRQYGGEQAYWLERLERDYENLRAALSWLSMRQEAELSLRLSGALYWFWTVRAFYKEGYSWAEKALANREGVAANVQAKALRNAGGLAYNLSKNDLAEQYCQESLEIYRRHNDAQGTAMTLYWLALIYCWIRHDYVRTRAYADEALALLTPLNDQSAMADVFLIIGYIYFNQGNYAEARPYLERGLNCFRNASDLWGMAYALEYLGRVMIELEDYTQADAKLDESLNISMQLGYMDGVAYDLGLKGYVALCQGDVATARRLIEESLTRHRERGQQSGLAESQLLLAKVYRAEKNFAAAHDLYEECFALGKALGEHDTWISSLEGLAAVSMAQGQVALAVLRWSVAAHQRKEVEIAMSRLDLLAFEQAEIAAHLQLGVQVYATIWEQGQMMTPEQALRTGEQEILATLDLSPVHPTPGRKSSPGLSYPNNLTTREVEVLRLIAQGWTDAQIAEHLVISLRTANKHATTIYSKIGVSSRSAATRFVIEHRLV